MVKVILGSAIGGLVAGGIALLAAGGDRAGAAPGTSMQPVAAPVLAQTAAPTVSCAPHQQAAVARVLINGAEAVTLACVDRVAAPVAAPVSQTTVPYAPAAYAPALDGYGAPSQLVTLAPAASPVEVVRVSQPAARPARRVVYQDDVVRYERDAKPRRSVAKTAMIIGGSAGTGAGVGAIVGGKKGALIGAAIGGGAASIFEATKR